MQLSKDLVKHRAEFQRAIRNHKWEQSEAGIVFPEQKAVLCGTYTHNVNGEDERIDHNLIPTEGINHILNVVLGASSKIGTWYHALSNANVSPAANWTGATYASNATENVSTSEGYAGANRKTFTPAAAAAAGQINSHADGFRSSFTIVTASTLALWGAALLSAQARGATTGVLLSAVKFASVRNLNNGDVFNTGYGVELAST